MCEFFYDKASMISSESPEDRHERRDLRITYSELKKIGGTTIEVALHDEVANGDTETTNTVIEARDD